MAKFKKLTQIQVQWILFGSKWLTFIIGLTALYTRNFYLGNTSLFLFIVLCYAITLRKKEEFLDFGIMMYHSDNDYSDTDTPFEVLIKKITGAMKIISFFSFAAIFFTHCVISLMVLEEGKFFTAFFANQTSALTTSIWLIPFKMVIAGVAVGLPAALVYAIGYLRRHIRTKQFQKRRFPYTARA